MHLFSYENVIHNFTCLNFFIDFSLWSKLKSPSSCRVVCPEIRDLQRSIETYDMQYFPHHVLLCTSTVHDQSANICLQGYLRILWIRNTISLKKTEFINIMFHVYNWSISLKVIKLNPWMGIMFNKWPWDGTLKTYRRNVVCRPGST